MKNLARAQPNVVLELNKAIKLIQQNKLSSASVVLKNLLSSVPNNADALHFLGIIELQNQHYQKSAEWIKKAISHRPNDKTFHYNLALSYQHQGRVNKAAQAYKKTIQLDAEHVNAMANLGSLYLHLGQYEEAETLFRMALEKSPSRADFLNNLGFCLFSTGKTNQALDFYRKAIAISPKNSEIQSNTGRAFQKKGEIEEAVACYKNAISINPKSVSAYNHLAFSNEILNNKQAARGFYKKALSIKPECAIANTALSIFAWLDHSMDICDSHLAYLNTYNQLDHTKAETKYIDAYRIFISELKKFSREKPEFYDFKKNDNETLHLLGDSHCLSFANTIVRKADKEMNIQSQLITGCKAWHLANKERNEFKENLTNRLNAIPQRSNVAFLFGEIDCRLDEGILPYCKKSGSDVATEVKVLVSNYFTFISRIAKEKQHSIYFVNVPASSKGHSDLDSLIFWFNEALESHAGKENIFDLYSLKETCKTQARKYHIDGIHLYPNVLTFA